LYIFAKQITIKNRKMVYSKTQIIQQVRELLPSTQFYLTKDGNLTMSLEGEFIDHEWQKGTFINK